MTETFRKHLRCHDCKLPPDLCFCAALEPIESPVDFTIVRGVREAHSQSNTGRLVARVFPGTRVLQYAEVMRSTDPREIWSPDVDHMVLFPDANAARLRPELLEESPRRRKALVLLDANWSGARRMARRIPGIRTLPFFSIDTDTAPTAMRKPIRPGELSTGEAAARALDALGLAEPARELQRVLDLVVSRVLHVRGKIPKRDVLPIGPRQRR